MDKDSKYTILWKQTIKDLIVSGTKLCANRLKNNKKIERMLYGKIEYVPKCIYSVSRFICKCRPQCLKEIKEIIEPFINDCSLYDQDKIDSNQFVNCQKSTLYFQENHGHQNIGFKRYQKYLNQTILSEGFKNVVSDFCLERMSQFDFNCFIFSFRDQCIIESDCYKLIEHLKNIYCSPQKFAQAFVFINEIFEKSVFREDFRKIKYLDTNAKDIKISNINQTDIYNLYSLYYSLLLKNVELYNNTLSNDIDISYNQMIFDIINKNQLYNMKSIMDFKVFFDNIAKIEKINDDKNFIVINNFKKNIRTSLALKEKDISSTFTTEINQIQNDSFNDFFPETHVLKNDKALGKFTFIKPKPILAYGMLGIIFLSTVICSIILYKSNLKKLVFSILVFLLLILNVAAVILTLI